MFQWLQHRMTNYPPIQFEGSRAEAYSRTIEDRTRSSARTRPGHPHLLGGELHFAHVQYVCNTYVCNTYCADRNFAALCKLIIEVKKLGIVDACICCSQYLADPLHPRSQCIFAEQ